MQNLILAAAFAGITVPALNTSPQSSDIVTPASERFAPSVANDRPDIIDTALASGDFNTLAAALTAADLVDTLKGDGPFTVFAPTDAAFAALPEGALDSLLLPENKADLTTILTYHVVAGAVDSSQVVQLDTAAALNGQPLDIQVSPRGVKIEDANLIRTDIQTSNGILHVIDAVLMPATDDIVDTAIAAGDFTTLTAALGAADLVDTLKGDGPFTVFAPTDAAFAALPAGLLDRLLEEENKDFLASILTYHVAEGRIPATEVVDAFGVDTVNGQRVDVFAGRRGVKLDAATIQVTDIQATNGTIHVIDAVLLPSFMNIVETTVEAGAFGTLVAALDAADLVDVLAGPGPFTVFAPTDAAFAKLPEGTVESLLLPENKAQLIAILRNHVISGRAYADELNARRVVTLDGNKLDIGFADGSVQVEAAKVIDPNRDTTNGVIHVIDAVLLP